MIHAIFDVTGCGHADAAPEAIMSAMRCTAGRLGCTTRSQVIEPFQPHGATCVLILAESHITVSTWPEHQLAHIDVFTCRADSTPGQAIQPILNLLAGQVTHAQNVPRTPPGSPAPPEFAHGPQASSPPGCQVDDARHPATKGSMEGLASDRRGTGK
jgi:S-adenosylmethionine decarboxylase